MEEKLGIETLKENVIAVAKIVTKVDTVLEDKKITFGEWTILAMDLPKIFKIAKTYKNSVAELKDLSQEEVVELNTAFAEYFDLRKDQVEQRVEQILNVIIAIAATFIKD